MNDQYIFSGIYSEKYSHYYEKLGNDLKKYLDLSDKNIYYYKISQEIFDNHKDFGSSKCYWCRKKVCKFVFHQGETIKIEKQLEIYKKYKNSGKIIVFTDCDTVINKNISVNLEKIYSHPNFNKFDIFYAKEKNRRRWRSGINIGLSLGYSNDKIIALYEQILNTMQKNRYPHNWDQIVVNHIFYKNLTPVKYDLLPDNLLFSHKFARGQG
jgi:hypothetical protein